MVINTLAVEAVFADLVTEQPQAVRLQRQCIQAALARHGGNRAGAARELDIDASNLHKLARRLALKEVTIPRQSRGHSGCEPLKAAVRGR